MPSAPPPLSAEQLRWRCDPASLGFSTTHDLEPLVSLDGERRWLQAIEFGIAVRRHEYNIFAIGPQGIGKEYLTQHLLQRQASQEPAPDDWCYVYNFTQPHIPNVLRLPSGRGRAFKADVEQLVSDLKEVLTATFEGEEYRSRRQLLEQELKDRQEQVFGDIEREAQQQSIAFLRTPMGFSFAPLKDGAVMQPQAYLARCTIAVSAGPDRAAATDLRRRAGNPGAYRSAESRHGGQRRCHPHYGRTDGARWWRRTGGAEPDAAPLWR